MRAAKGCQVCRRSRNGGTDREKLQTIMDALSKTGKRAKGNQINQIALELLI